MHEQISQAVVVMQKKTFQEQTSKKLKVLKSSACFEEKNNRTVPCLYVNLTILRKPVENVEQENDTSYLGLK